MLYTIGNDELQVQIKSTGAELASIRTSDGREYLWQGDPAYWKGQSPNLFPYVGRLTDKTYTLKGETRHMEMHGFIKPAELAAESETADSVTLFLKESEATLAQYPFKFEYRIRYSLEGRTLTIVNEVKNTGDERMYFGIGGHPGFNVPMDEGLSFEDYALVFSEKCRPSLVSFSPDVFVTGEFPLYPLEEDQKLPLAHELFNIDAVVLKDASRTVRICSDKGEHFVEVSYPDYPYVGFWHMPKTDAPYVCVEPWRSLPSRKGVIEDLAQQSDLVSLPAGETYINTWQIRVG